MPKDMTENVERSTYRNPETMQAAAKYMIRTRRADLLAMLGLDEVPVPERYAAARDKLLSQSPAVVPGKAPRRVHRAAARNRNLPNCTCAPTGLPYRLCPEHGEPGIAVAPQKLP